MKLRYLLIAFVFVFSVSAVQVISTESSLAQSNKNQNSKNKNKKKKSKEKAGNKKDKERKGKASKAAQDLKVGRKVKYSECMKINVNKYRPAQFHRAISKAKPKALNYLSKADKVVANINDKKQKIKPEHQAALRAGIESDMSKISQMVAASSTSADNTFLRQTLCDMYYKVAVFRADYVSYVVKASNVLVKIPVFESAFELPANKNVTSQLKPEIENRLNTSRAAIAEARAQAEESLAQNLSATVPEELHPIAKENELVINMKIALRSYTESLALRAIASTFSPDLQLNLADEFVLLNKDKKPIDGDGGGRNARIAKAKVHATGPGVNGDFDRQVKRKDAASPWR